MTPNKLHQKLTEIYNDLTEMHALLHIYIPSGTSKKRDIDVIGNQQKRTLMVSNKVYELIKPIRVIL